MVVRRYIDFSHNILVIPTPIVAALFCNIPTFCSFLNIFLSNCLYFLL